MAALTTVEMWVLGIATVVTGGAIGFGLYERNQALNAQAAPPAPQTLAVTSGGTYTISLAANGGTLAITTPAGSTNATDTVTPSTSTSSSVAPTASYTVNGAASQGQLAMGANVVTVTWTGSTVSTSPGTKVGPTAGKKSTGTQQTATITINVA